jgi:hypothetical protein
MAVSKPWIPYIFSRLLVLLMRDISILCFIYFFVAFSWGGVVAISHPVSLVIEIYGLVELLFFVGFFIPYRWFLQTWCPYKPPPLSRASRSRLFYKALSLIPDGELFMRKWMANAPLEDVRRDNAKDWLLWALFEKDGLKESVDPDIEEELEEYIQNAEERLGLRLKPGRADVEVLRLIFDPVVAQHRTLLFYLVNTSLSSVHRSM